MAYTESRLQHYLSVYRAAWLRDAQSSSSSTSLQRHLRNDYCLRQVSATSLIGQTTSWDDEAGSSSDEWNPTISKKRRSTVRDPKVCKRVRRSVTRDGGNVQPSNTRQEDDQIIPTLITLRANSRQGKALLNQLAQLHGTGYESEFDKGPVGSWRREGGFGHVTNRKPEDCRKPKFVAETYLGRLDVASRAIDNSHSRQLRNRTIRDEDRFAQRHECVACKKAKKRCSLKKLDQPPCTRCHTEGLDCVKYTPGEEPEILDNPSVTLSKAPTLPTPSSSLETPSQIIRAHAAAQQFGPMGPLGVSKENPIVVLDSPCSLPTLASDGTVVVIKTHWAHPINFQHIPTPKEPCHFCSDFRYGIFGYGLLDAEVIRYPGAADLQETGNGFRAQGREATRMCVSCSLSRLHISRCKIHLLQRSAYPRDDLIQAYTHQLTIAKLLPALSSGACRPCALCPQPAIWKCCADQRLDRMGRRVSETAGKGKGCGLILCDSCAKQVHADGGVLKRNTVLAARRNSFNIGQRADMDFLFPGSLLHQAFSKKAG